MMTEGKGQGQQQKTLYTSESVQRSRKPQLLFKNKFKFSSTILAGSVLGKTMTRFLQSIPVLEAKNQQTLNSHNSKSVSGYF